MNLGIARIKMDIILAICVLGLVSALIPTLAKPSLQALFSDRLDLTDGVRFFQECYVHLIQAHFEIVEASNHSYEKSYELAPFKFPVVFNRYDFRIQHYPKWTQKDIISAAKACINLDPELSETSWRKFTESEAQQNRRSPCTVILYVDSPLCDGPPLREPPHGFVFALHNVVRFSTSNINTPTLAVNQFIVHVGRRHHNWNSYVWEYWYQKSSNAELVLDWPVVVLLRFYTEKKGNTLGWYGYLTTCPDNEAYRRLTTRECSQNIRDSKSYTRPYLLCLIRFSRYLLNAHKKINADDVESWRSFITIRNLAPCKQTLLKAANPDDLPRRASKVEYLLDWMDRVGAANQIFTRIFLHNFTYTNEDEIMSPNKYQGNFNQLNGFGVVYGYWVAWKLDFPPIIAILRLVNSPDIQSELFYQSTQNDQVRFVMCSFASERGKMSLLGFVSAFRWEVWVAFASTVLAGGFIFQIAVNKIFNLKYIGEYVVVEEIWRIILTQGTGKLKTIKWFYGSWAISGLVLTNLYLGDNINKLTAPLPILTWDTFPQILENNLTIYSPNLLLTSYTYYSSIFSIFTDGGEKGDFREIAEDGMAKSLTLFGNLFNEIAENNMAESLTIFGYLFLKKLLKLDIAETFARLGQIESNKSNVLDSLEPGYFLSIVSRCTSEPYVDVLSEITKVKLQLLRKIANGSVGASSDNVIVSKDLYGNIYHNIMYVGVRLTSTMILQRFHSFLHSGIDGLWLKWHLRIGSWNDTVGLARNSPEEEFKPAKLSGNIRVVFYVHLCLISLGITAFFAEILKSGKFTTKNIYIALKQFFKSLYQLSLHVVLFLRFHKCKKKRGLKIKSFQRSSCDAFFKSRRVSRRLN